MSDEGAAQSLEEPNRDELRHVKFWDFTFWRYVSPPSHPPLQKKSVKALHATSLHKKHRGQAHKHKPTLPLLCGSSGGGGGVAREPAQFSSLWNRQWKCLFLNISLHLQTSDFRGFDLSDRMTVCQNKRQNRMTLGLFLAFVFTRLQIWKKKKLWVIHYPVWKDIFSVKLCHVSVFRLRH